MDPTYSNGHSSRSELETILSISYIDWFDRHMVMQLPMPSCERYRGDESSPLLWEFTILLDMYKISEFFNDPIR